LAKNGGLNNLSKENRDLLLDIANKGQPPIKGTGLIDIKT
jgi:hypothetical protein